MDSSGMSGSGQPPPAARLFQAALHHGRAAKQQAAMNELEQQAEELKAKVQALSDRLSACIPKLEAHLGVFLPRPAPQQEPEAVAEPAMAGAAEDLLPQQQQQQQEEEQQGWAAEAAARPAVLPDLYQQLRQRMAEKYASAEKLLEALHESKQGAKDKRGGSGSSTAARDATESMPERIERRRAAARHSNGTEPRSTAAQAAATAADTAATTAVTPTTGSATGPHSTRDTDQLPTPFAAPPPPAPSEQPAGTGSSSEPSIQPSTEPSTDWPSSLVNVGSQDVTPAGSPLQSNSSHASARPSQPGSSRMLSMERSIEEEPAAEAQPPLPSSRLPPAMAARDSASPLPQVESLDKEQSLADRFTLSDDIMSGSPQLFVLNSYASQPQDNATGRYEHNQGGPLDSSNSGTTDLFPLSNNASRGASFSGVPESNTDGGQAQAAPIPSRLSRTPPLLPAGPEKSQVPAPAAFRVPQLEASNLHSAAESEGLNVSLRSMPFNLRLPTSSPRFSGSNHMPSLQLGPQMPTAPELQRSAALAATAADATGIPTTAAPAGQAAHPTLALLPQGAATNGHTPSQTTTRTALPAVVGSTLPTSQSYSSLPPRHPMSATFGRLRQLLGKGVPTNQASPSLVCTSMAPRASSSAALSGYLAATATTRSVPPDARRQQARPLLGALQELAADDDPRQPEAGTAAAASGSGSKRAVQGRGAVHTNGTDHGSTSPAVSGPAGSKPAAALRRLSHLLQPAKT